VEQRTRAGEPVDAVLVSAGEIYPDVVDGE